MNIIVPSCTLLLSFTLTAFLLRDSMKPKATRLFGRTTSVVTPILLGNAGMYFLSYLAEQGKVGSQDWLTSHLELPWIIPQGLLILLFVVGYKDK